MSSTAVREEEKTVANNNLNNIFPEVFNIFSKESAAEVSTKNELLVASNFDMLTRAHDLGQPPKELQFFHGGKSKEFGERLYSLDLDDSSIMFADSLMSKECRVLLRTKYLFIWSLEIYFSKTKIAEKESMISSMHNRTIAKNY